MVGDADCIGVDPPPERDQPTAEGTVTVRWLGGGVDFDALGYRYRVVSMVDHTAESTFPTVEGGLSPAATFTAVGGRRPQRCFQARFDLGPLRTGARDEGIHCLPNGSDVIGG